MDFSRQKKKKEMMAVLNYKRTRWRSSLFVLLLCLEFRGDATAAGESEAAKKCDEIQIGELIV